ncbi:hypothetical protein ACSMXN_15360 [Jatrophihabitans sp. DSM 45814]
MVTAEESAAEQHLTETPEGERRSRFGWRPHFIDVALAALLALATFVVHSMHYVFTAPFWTDEAWVAVSTKMSVRQVPHVTSVVPLGWSLLQRFIVFGGDQRLRALPLLFSALTVVVAFVLLRSLPWGSTMWSRVAGVLGGVAVLLAPSTLVRNDLKQYTADAFATLLILFLMARTERSWSRRRLLVLAISSLVLFTISVPVLFVAVAAFGALLIASVLRRNWHQLAELAIVAGGSMIALGVIYLAIYKSHQGTSLTSYWNAYYLPHTAHGALHYLNVRGHQMATYLGMGPLLLCVLLVLAGVATLVLIGQPALAIAGPLLTLEMIVLGAAKKYPLFDERTSHFLTMVFAVYAAIGVAGICVLVARRAAPIAALIAVAAMALFAINVRGDIRVHSIPREDVRTPTQYAANHVQPSDVVLVNLSGNWGFAYYWPDDNVGWQPSKVVATDFLAGLPDDSRVIFAADRTKPAVDSAVARAVTEAASRPGARIWIVRSHVTAAENAAWQAAINRQHVKVESVIRCSLLLLTPLPQGADVVNAPVTVGC